jgi:tRNA pseudouridine55 synthase
VAEPGFVAVDKPPGPTSFDIVATVRRLSGVRKVGHAGTLDPMSSGLLVLALGRATRLVRFLQDLPKVYVARAQFGVATDTLDAEGAVLSREEMPVTSDEVAVALDRFRGDILQVPPMVSALKVEGRRLYELAREGREVERAPRPVTIHELELVDLAPSDYPVVTLRVRCSKGTYVRTLADDVARALGGRAHLVALRRLAIGSLRVDDALTLEAIDAEPDLLDRDRLGPGDGLVDLPLLAVSDDLARGVRHGTPLTGGALGGLDVPAGRPFRVVGPGNEFLAVYRAEDDRAVAEVVIG